MTTQQYRIAVRRLASTLRTYADGEGLSIEELASALDVTRATAYQLVGSMSRSAETARAVKLPRIPTLRRIAELTGVSVDWLLGFDVPKLWAQRTAIGALAAELETAIYAATPEFASPGESAVSLSGEAREIADPRLVQEVVSLWWRARLESYAVTRSQQLMALAGLLTSDALREASPIARESLLATARNLEAEALLLRSPGVTWLQVRRYEPAKLTFFNGRAEVHPVPSPVAPPDPDRFPPVVWWKTSLNAVGGASGLGHYEIDSRGRDRIWYIDGETGKALRLSGEGLLLPRDAHHRPIERLWSRNAADRDGEVTVTEVEEVAGRLRVRRRYHVDSGSRETLRDGSAGVRRKRPDC